MQGGRVAGDAPAQGKPLDAREFPLLWKACMQKGRRFLLAVVCTHLLCGVASADLLTPLAESVSAPRKVKKPKRGMQMTIGPIEVPKGSEITECTYFKCPAPHDMAVNRVRIDVQGG